MNSLFHLAFSATGIRRASVRLNERVGARPDGESRVSAPIQNQEVTVEAVPRRDLELALRVFMHDPTLAAAGFAGGRTLFDGMIRDAA
jgi:alpha-galactosidase/6-phospho-beta-glucosidase family protein